MQAVKSSAGGLAETRQFLLDLFLCETAGDEMSVLKCSIVSEWSRGSRGSVLGPAIYLGSSALILSAASAKCYGAR